MKILFGNAKLPAKLGTWFLAMRRNDLPLWGLAGWLLLGTAGSASAQQRPDFVRFINTENAWVDSVFRSLAPRERIAQLFLARAHSNLGQGYIDSVGRMIEKQQLGGVVLFQGGPLRHAQMLNRYQKLAKVPLLVAFDGEWGLGMRLRDSAVSYPYQMTLGAVQDDRLIYEMGRQVARDFRRLGMHFNFAPVVDVNNNPKNPVINYRSFGDDRDNVTRKARAYMQGMVDGGIIGHDGRGQGVSVSCKGTVQARFVNHAKISAGVDVVVEREIVNSEVLAGGQVTVGVPGATRGSIAGGRCCALTLVRAPRLGTQGGIATHVQVGLDPHAESRRTELDAEREKLQAERVKMEQLIAFLRANPTRAVGGVGERSRATHLKVGQRHDAYGRRRYRSRSESLQWRHPADR